MKHYVGLHHHRHGISTYILKSDHEPTEDEFMDVLEEEFEEDREEWLEIIESSLHKSSSQSEDTPAKHYVGLHHHKHGIGAYIFEGGDEPSEDEFASFLGDDFEPDREEWLEVIKTDVTEIAA
jgi:hypothetical protein